MRVFRTCGALVAAAVLTVSVSACGSSSSNDNAGPTSQDTCFQQMTPDQVTQMSNYANQTGATINSISSSGQGTQDVCVMTPDGNGGYAQHYYTQNDGFSNYFLYAMMFRNVHPLVGYGLLSGSLSPSDAIMLSLLTGIDSGGGLYHPYTRTNAGWAAQASPITNVHVTNVYYGNRNAGSYATAYSQPPPSGYARSSMTKPNNSVMQVNDSKSGMTGTVQNGQTASSVLKKAGVKTTPYKQVAPPLTNQNLNKVGGSSGPGGATSKPKPGGGTPNKPKMGGGFKGGGKK
jgi:hypothetical protein